MPNNIYSLAYLFENKKKALFGQHKTDTHIYFLFCLTTQYSFSILFCFFFISNLTSYSSSVPLNTSVSSSIISLSFKISFPLTTLFIVPGSAEFIGIKSHIVDEQNGEQEKRTRKEKEKETPDQYHNNNKINYRKIEFKALDTVCVYSSEMCLTRRKKNRIL